MTNGDIRETRRSSLFMTDPLLAGYNNSYITAFRISEVYENY